MKIHYALEQGSDLWHAVRAGRATASCFSDVLAKGQGKTRANYLRRVVAERLTGKAIESRAYGSWGANLDRGHEQEPLAGMAYELATDHLITRVGFIEHDTLLAGCSPDGLIVGLRRGVEIKCVLPHVQVETILSGNFPSEHRAQIQGSMWITEFEEWDFCSYSPDFKDERDRTYIVTVKRDEAYIKALEIEVQTFLNEVAACIVRMTAARQDIAALLRQSIRAAA